MGLAALARFAALIARRRTAADWRLQAAAGFGMVLAVALMAAGVIYSNALRETALEHTLREEPQEELDLSVRVNSSLNRPAFDAISRVVEERVQQPLSAHFPDSTLLIQTISLYFTGLPQLDLPDKERPRGALHAITGLEENTRLVEGRLPRRGLGELEMAIDPLGTSALDLAVGQSFGIYPTVGGDEVEAIPVRVVGIIEPLEPSDQYWQLGSRDRTTNTEREFVAVPLYTDRDAILDTAGASFPGLHTGFMWLFHFDREGLEASQVGELRAGLDDAKDGLRSVFRNAGWNTELDEVLDRYSDLLLLARVPLLLVVFLAVGLLLYYLFLIAGLMGRLRAPEVALFRSRGASTPQVGLIILVEGLLLAVPAVAIGPFLAQVLVLLTGRLFPAAAGGQGFASVDLSPSVFLLGAGGALLAVAVLTFTALNSARHGVVAFHSTAARPPQVPFLHRYYLDLVLLALIGMVWWQLKSRGSFLVQPVGSEGREIDLTLLLGPVLGVVAAGLVVLRVYPIALKLVAWVAEPFGPVWLAHSLRRVVRDPVPSGSLLVLLALATSLGVLSSAVIATLERSQRDQALYEAGADVRIAHSLGGQVATGDGVARTVSSLPEVAAAADVMRLETRVTTKAFGEDAVLLAVDVDSFPEVAWSRDDLIGRPVEEALEPLGPAEVESEGIALPPDADGLGLWVQAGLLDQDTPLLARLRDSQGVYFDMLLGEVLGQGWRYLEAPIQPAPLRSRREVPTVVPPYTLHTLWVGRRTTGALFLDQLQAITPAGPVEVESFQTLDGWHPLEDAFSPGLYSLDLSEAAARSGRRSAVFTWSGGGLASRGIRSGPPERPLPALVSSSFLDANQVQVGDTVSASLGNLLVPMKIEGVAEFFPTLEPRETPFIVIDLESVLRYIALHAVRPAYLSMEVWARSADGDLSAEPLSQAIVDMGGEVFETFEAAEMVATREGDPLLTAGWSGLLALAFLAVVLAAASGLILYTYIDARERQGEFAVLRALGFSPGQVNGVVWFSLALTVVLGVGLGTLGGQLLGGAVLPLLEVAEGGTRITPPMVLETNWLAIGIAYLVLALATLVTVVALAWAIGRLEVQRILRLAEA